MMQSAPRRARSRIWASGQTVVPSPSSASWATSAPSWTVSRSPPSSDLGQHGMTGPWTIGTTGPPPLASRAGPRNVHRDGVLGERGDPENGDAGLVRAAVHVVLDHHLVPRAQHNGLAGHGQSVVELRVDAWFGARYLDRVHPATLGRIPVSYTHLRAHETRHDL